MTGIYIHVPFCLRRCLYCDFHSGQYSEVEMQAYVNAVCRNIRALEGLDIKADTVYFGGGTPSLLTGGQLSEIMQSLAASISLCDAEVTLEANPSSITEKKLDDWKKSGVNRLSIGLQSADDSQLKFLGRLHDSKLAQDSVKAAHRAGFENISCDVMLGLAGQDISSLDRTLDVVFGLPVVHLSAYMLTIEEGTAFDCEEVRAKTADEDLMCDLYLHLCERAEAQGFEHYEISNFALPGRRSRHNMKYWSLTPYIGIGASAHSDYGGRRYYCPPDTDRFIHSQFQPLVTESEAPDRFEEYVMLGLRTSDGIDRRKLGSRADEIFERAEKYVNDGLAEMGAENLRLNEKGFLLSNMIIAELLK